MSEFANGEEPAQYIVARIRDALAHDERVAALDIAVRIVGHDVYLTGSVATAQRRSAAEVVTRSEVGECTVHNQLVVLEPKAPDGLESVT